MMVVSQTALTSCLGAGGAEKKRLWAPALQQKSDARRYIIIYNVCFMLQRYKEITN
jgi:hypothetical protein